MQKGPVTFESQTENPEIPGVLDISAAELKEKQDQVHLIDVRRPDEFTGELGHIQNSKLIVLDTLPDHLEQLPKGETIVFICRSGARSARAAAWAMSEGLGPCYNLQGGMIRWNALGFKVEK